MQLVSFPPSQAPKRVSFYLAAEEWLTKRYPDRRLVMMWVTEPTVIIGRNQLMLREVDVDFCNARGITVMRRRSGGGAVVSDGNNVMFSLISPSADVQVAFCTYTTMIVSALQSLGLYATANTRNDILLSGRKVAGNAYYRTGAHSIVHGTMLFDFDPVIMTGALKPSAEKLASKGVSSVRSRVTTVREHLPALTLEEFHNAMAKGLPVDGSIAVSSAELAEIEEIERSRYDKAWVQSHQPPATLRASRHFDGVGELEMHLAVSDNIITHCALTGDYFSLGDASEALSKCLVGIPLTRLAVEEALVGTNFSDIIPQINQKQIVNLIF